MAVEVEFTVEPFLEGSPGAHVDAALEAVRSEGLEIEVGPFGSSFVGGTEQAARTIDRIVADAIGAGATRISVQVTVVDP